MDTAKIVRDIDSEIARLTAARKILTGSNSRMHARQPTKRAASKRVVRTRRPNGSARQAAEGFLN